MPPSFSHFEANEAIIDQCRDLIKQHNKISYSSVALDENIVTFANVCPRKSPYATPKDALATIISQFFTPFAQQVTILCELNAIIDKISYTHEDLMMHIDRSTDTVVQIFSALSSTRIELAKCRDQLSDNIDAQAKDIVDVVAKVTSDNDVSEIFGVIEVCMSWRSDKDPECEYPFMEIGIAFIRVLYKSEILSVEHVQAIRDLSIRLKELVLRNEKHFPGESLSNRLQTFGIVPDEGGALDASVVIQKLLGVAISPSSDPIDAMSRAMKSASEVAGIRIGAIIIASPNDDRYFDMTSLAMLSQPIGSGGVTPRLIAGSDLFKEGAVATLKAAGATLMNTSLENVSERTYVMWTNDMHTFKIRARPVDAQLAKKLLRRRPSELVESYNALCGGIISSARTEDAISFNRVQYMSVDGLVTESQFLASLSTKLIKVIVANVKNAKLSDTFGDALLEAIDGHKHDLGVLPSQLSSHCHIMYAAMASKLESKIRRDLLAQSQIDRDAIKPIVDLALKTNDNIYSRMIACYYLQIA